MIKMESSAHLIQLFPLLFGPLPQRIYHGGVFGVLVGPDELNVSALLDRVKDSESEVEELILATSAGVEGEATAVYLEGLFRPLGVRVTRLARGIPVGSDLEYVDGSTLSEALSGRREM